VVGGQRGNPHVHLVVADLFDDPAVLRDPALGDVHVGHHLDARNDRQGEVDRRRRHLVERAIDPVADLEVLLEGLEVDVRGLFLDRLTT
jgi:hypothetical protein